MQKHVSFFNTLGSLRRRDTLKASSRYSPPPPAPTRSRGTNRIFPSTSHSNHTIDADATEEATPVAPVTTIKTEAVAAPTGSSRRKSLGLRNTTANATTVVTTVENIEISKKDGDQIVLQLKDGTQQSVCLLVCPV